MKLRAKQHPADVLAEWVAPAILAVAAGWSVSRLSGSMVAAAGAAVAALAVGLTAMRLLGTAREIADAPFEPVPLDDCIEEIDELLLDDPLVEIEDDSRVVRLFAREEATPGELVAREEATPGELVARIEDFLGEERQVLAISAEEGSASPPDASAALHAALANIRASLR